MTNSQIGMVTGTGIRIRFGPSSNDPEGTPGHVEDMAERRHAARVGDLPRAAVDLEGDPGCELTPSQVPEGEARAPERV